MVVTLVFSQTFPTQIRSCMNYHIKIKNQKFKHDPDWFQWKGSSSKSLSTETGNRPRKKKTMTLYDIAYILNKDLVDYKYIKLKIYNKNLPTVLSWVYNTTPFLLT